MMGNASADTSTVWTNKLVLMILCDIEHRLDAIKLFTVYGRYVAHLKLDDRDATLFFLTIPDGSLC